MCSQGLARVASAWDPRASWRSLSPQTSPTTGHFAPLDGARAISLLWVLSYHTIFLACARLTTDGLDMPIAKRWKSSWASQFAANGDAGVDVFFVLSGFLMGHIWLKEVLRTGSFRYGRFLERRFLRLFPMMAVAVGYAALVAMAARDESDVVEACAKDWWRILLFISNFPVSPCLSQSWSLAAEFQLYLVSPLIMWAAFSPGRKAPRRYGMLGLVVGSFVGMAVRMVIMTSAGPAAFSTASSWSLTFDYVSSITRSMPYISGLLGSIVVLLSQRNSSEERALCTGGPGLQTDTCSISNGSKSPSHHHISKSLKLESGSYLDEAAEGLPSMLRAPVIGVSENADQLPSWSRRILPALDMLSLLVICGLAYSGVGHNDWTRQRVPLFNNVLQVAGRWALGWPVANVFMAVLLGRLRLVNRFLSLGMFKPIAALSYSAYLLQLGPITLLPSWAALGITTMPMAWGYAGLAFIFVSLSSVGLALPAYILVERPFMRLCPDCGGRLDLARPQHSRSDAQAPLLDNV